VFCWGASCDSVLLGVRVVTMFCWGCELWQCSVGGTSCDNVLLGVRVVTVFCWGCELWQCSVGGASCDSVLLGVRVVTVFCWGCDMWYLWCCQMILGCATLSPEEWFLWFQGIAVPSTHDQLVTSSAGPGRFILHTEFWNIRQCSVKLRLWMCEDSGKGPNRKDAIKL
jgi:hypothetical protein